jgi:uncharacterized membrane protein YedE/YeeE
MQALAGLFSGLLFGAGLALSGMTQPSKVIGFLDLTGDWDPSLAFVMGGAIAVFAPLYRVILRATQPVYVQQFVISASRQIDAPLVVGAAIFGAGWGLGGYCPGPALVALGTLAPEAVVFVLSMLAGMALHLGYERVVRVKRSAAVTS